MIVQNTTFDLPGIVRVSRPVPNSRYDEHMLSEAQQKRVWEGMLASEIRANYFAELSGIFLRRQQFATWATLLFSSADVAAFLAKLPEELTWIRLACAVCTAATSIYLALSGNERKAFDSKELYSRLNRLHAAYQEIWENVNSDGAADRIKPLEDQAIEASNLAITLPNHEKSMLKWQNHTEKHYLQTHSIA
jgi:hypothetical protein